MNIKWTKKQLCNHIKKNSQFDNYSYSLTVVLSAIYLKLYGELPKSIGLSGAQAESARSIVRNLPNRCVNDFYA